MHDIDTQTFLSFIGVLFVDAVQRMLRITAESEAAKQQQGGVKDVRVETSFAARKFYAQRNTYLTGASLSAMH
jgi:B-cell receptor-associated protein 31